MTETRPFRGVLSPVLTPYDRHLNPEPARFVAHAQWLLEDGCTGLAPFGTTGEAVSLGLEERIDLLDALVDGGIDPAVLLPGTGVPSIADSVRLTRHAVERGCGGVMMLPPFYYKGVSDDGVFAFFSEVIDRVGDARTKIYLYHIPPQAVIGFSLDLVGRLIDAFPETIVGLKDSSGDWSYTAALLEAFPGFGTLSGSEVFLLDNLRGGGAGCITATGNVNARRIARLFEQWQGADADAWQAELIAMRRCIEAQPMIPMLKHIIAAARGDAVWTTVRPPFTALSAEGAAGVLRQLDEVFGFTLDLTQAAA